MSPYCPTCGEVIEGYRMQCGACGHLKDVVEHHEILKDNGGAAVAHTFRCSRCFPTWWEAVKQWVGGLFRRG
jgi:hypothetical protein